MDLEYAVDEEADRVRRVHRACGEECGTGQLVKDQRSTPNPVPNMHEGMNTRTRVHGDTRTMYVCSVWLIFVH